MRSAAAIALVLFHFSSFAGTDEQPAREAQRRAELRSAIQAHRQSAAQADAQTRHLSADERAELRQFLRQGDVRPVAIKDSASKPAVVK